MQVKAIRNCFVDGGYRKEGEEFTYSGPPNGNLEPLDKADREKWSKGTFAGPKIAGTAKPGQPANAAQPAKPAQPANAAQPEKPAEAEASAK